MKIYGISSNPELLLLQLVNSEYNSWIVRGRLYSLLLLCIYEFILKHWSLEFLCLIKLCSKLELLLLAWKYFANDRAMSQINNSSIGLLSYS